MVITWFKTKRNLKNKLKSVNHSLPINIGFRKRNHKRTSSKEEVQMTSNQINYTRNEQQNRFNTGSLAETGRHNVATEDISRGTLSENQRHNKSTEDIGYRGLIIDAGKLTESERTNRANEGIKQQDVNIKGKELGIKQQQADASAVGAIASAKNADTARLGYHENVRHNLQGEQIDLFNTAFTGVRTLTGIVPLL